MNPNHFSCLISLDSSKRRRPILRKPLRNILGVAVSLTALLLLGSIHFEPRAIPAQASSPSATSPFNGWLVLSGGQAQVPYDTEISLDPGSPSFTLEGWLYNPYFATSSGSYDVVSKRPGFSLATDATHSSLPPPGIQYYAVIFFGCSTSTICIGNQTHTLNSCAGSCVPPTGWFHFAYVYNQSTGGTLFWNGQMLGSGGESIPNISTAPLVLKNAVRMDEFRISNNVRYSSNFTIPSAPFVCDTNTMALWHFDEVQGSTTFHDSCGATDNVMTGSNGAHTEGVTGQPTTTALVSSANPSGVGHPVNFTATVSGSGGTPTGTVAFKDGGTDITGCGTQPLSSGQATCSTSSLTVGSHTITAVYGGDTIFAPSTSAGLIQSIVVMYDLYLPLVTR